MWRMMPHIRSRFSLNKEYLTTYDENIKMYCRLNDHIESQIFWQGMQEGDVGVYRVIKDLLKQGDVFFDIGACVGTFSLIAANIVKASGRVYAFEPVLKHFERLKRNIALNGFENILLFKLALSDKNGGGKIFIPKTLNTGMASLSANNMQWADYEVEEVELKKLDNFVKEQDVKRIDIIKIDVEGHELAVIKGAINSINKFKPRIIMEVNRGFLQKAKVRAEEFVRFFKEYDYRLYRIDHDYKEYNLKPIEREKDFYEHQNVMAAPDKFFKNTNLGG